MKINIKIFLILFASLKYCFNANAQCASNQISFISDNINWSLIDNNIGLPNNTSAYVIPHLVIPNVYYWDSVALGNWISCLSTGLHPTNGNGPNQSMKFRYVFKSCGIDTLEMKLNFFRDNFCNIYLDGILIFSDVQAPPSNQINLNVGTSITYNLPVSGSSAQSHYLDFEIIEFNIGYNNNGWGGKLNGIIKSNKALNSIILNTHNCANYICCSNSNLEITGNKQLCKGQITTLSASGGNSYEWLDANNVSLSNSNTISISPTTTTTYQVISTDVSGCSLTKNVTITVDTMPIITVSSANNISCAKASSVLSCNGFAQNYNWSPASLVSNAQSSTTIATPIVNTIFTVTASNGGCSTSRTVEVLLDSNYITNVAVPNAITANNDGLNDCFKILSKKQFIQFDCNIYNRLGQLVFKTNDPNFCWYAEINGQETTGNEVFFYHLKAITDCKEFFQKGDVTVIR